MLMSTVKTAFLQFSPDQNNLGQGKELRAGLSAVVQIGDTLWLANDETTSLELLSLVTGETPTPFLWFLIQPLQLAKLVRARWRLTFSFQ